MAITFAMNSVLDRLTQSVAASMTAAGEAPKLLPRATTAAQVAFYAKELPSTIIAVGDATFSEEDANTGSLRFRQEVMLHHLRPLSPGGSAVSTATALMAAVATGFYTDYQLKAVSAGGDPPVEMVRTLCLVTGEGNSIQQMLDQADQASSVCAVALKIEVDWVESPDPAPLVLPAVFS